MQRLRCVCSEVVAAFQEVEGAPAQGDGQPERERPVQQHGTDRGRAGKPGASAVSAVLLFRILTFYLPVPLGWGAFNFLERRHYL